MDANADGNEDLVINAGNTCYWIQNNLDGTFQNPIEFNGSIGSRSVQLFDLGEDGDQDLFYINELGPIGVFVIENNGNGSFTEPQLVHGSASVQTYHVGDYDSNGFSEILLDSGPYSFSPLILSQNGMGEWEDFETNLLPLSQPFITDMVFADLSGDSLSELIYCSFIKDQVVVFENLNEGDFSDEIFLLEYGEDVAVTRLGDLDGDGDLDVVYAGDNVFGWYTDLYWIENTGGGDFGEPTLISNIEGNEQATFDIHLEDLDQDGDLDVVSIYQQGGLVCWNDGSGSFDIDSSIFSGINDMYSLDMGDFNGDDLADMLVTTFESSGGVYVLINEGEGSFLLPNEISEFNLASGAAVADINNDGDLDAVFFTATNAEILWFENNSGVFENVSNLVGQVSAQNVPKDLVVFDFDGDDDNDIISSDGSSLTFFANTGQGFFPGEISIGTVDDVITKVLSVDMDSDNLQDVVFTTDHEIYWMRNTGEGVFSAPILLSEWHADIRYIDAGDIDGDGVIDIVCADVALDRLSWFSSIIVGCTSPEACNYLESAEEDDGSCCFGSCGCTNLSAFNYSPGADCDDGSCLFEVSGTVFFDENENGVWDESDEEYPLALQEVEISPSGWTTWTNDEGEFTLYVPEGDFALQVITSDLLPFSTTTNPLNIEVNAQVGGLLFGLSSESPEYNVFVDFYATNGYPCDDWVRHNICFRNEGNVIMNGYLEVEISELFQDYQEITPIDSVVENRIYMSFENLYPGQMFFYDVELLTPTVDFIGEYLTSEASVYGFYEDQQVAFSSEERTIEMTCAYDPNDKQVFPNGYAEPHFILNDTELEYLIRFQNTGNAPATNVLVTDTLDENLNMETFALIANSHSVQTTLKPEERVVEFFFENIMLPDSVNNEPESHGLVSFVITPFSDLAPGTELNNTGNIYFDNNPPIITNTTWNTIYECTDDLAFVADVPDNICSNEELNLTSTEEYIEEYSWSSGINQLSAASVLQTTLDPGMQVILFEVENPLCVATNTMTIDVLESPEIEVSEDVSVCEGEETIITATSEDELEWIGLGMETEYTVSPLETEEYIAVANNDLGCEAQETVVITVHPLPSIDAGIDLQICSGDTIELIASGSDQVQWIGFDPGLSIVVSPEEDTEYEVVAMNEFDCEASDAMQLNVADYPDTPVISTFGNDLSTDPSNTYQWYLNGAPIEGAMDQDYVIDQDGDYAVEVTNEFGCSAISDAQSLTYVGVDELSVWDGLKVYPNPATDQVMVEGSTQQGVVEVYDASGRMVLSENFIQSKFQMDVSSLSEGIYQLVMISEDGLVRGRVMVRR